LGSKAEEFIDSKTTYIELIKILPKCRIATYFNDDGSKTFEKECFNETIIKKDNFIDSGVKIELEEDLVGMKNIIKNSDFKAFLKSLYGQKVDLKDYTIDSCYVPRHGICFYDSDKKRIGFFEICFECRNYKTAGEIPRLILLSETEFEVLMELFAKYNMAE